VAPSIYSSSAALAQTSDGRSPLISEYLLVILASARSSGETLAGGVAACCDRHWLTFRFWLSCYFERIHLNDGGICGGTSCGAASPWYLSNVILLRRTCSIDWRRLREFAFFLVLVLLSWLFPYEPQDFCNRCCCVVGFLCCSVL
jgi:hypothetical protein